MDFDLGVLGRRIPGVSAAEVGTVLREYGRVHSAFWSSADIQALSDDARLLALYLLTCTHGTIAGAFRLPDGYVSEDMGWAPERVSKGFLELLSKGFSNRCETTKWVWVKRFLHWNAPENPNQWKAVLKVAAQIPEKCAWRADFERDLAGRINPDSPPNPNPSGTVSEPFRNHISSQHTSTAPQQQQEPNTPSASATPTRRQVSRGTPPEEPEWLLEFKLAYPQRSGDQGWRKAVRAAHARIAEGHTSAEFLVGARRYAAYCEAAGKTGTEYVKQACTFLGPDKPFLLPWHPPPKPETAMDRILRANGGNDNSRVIEHDSELRALTG